MSNAIRFTVPAGHKLENCCAKDGARFALSNVLAFKGGEQSYLTATNTRVLAVLPISPDGGDFANPTFLPPKAMNANGKAKRVEVNGEVRTSDGKKTEVYPIPNEEGFFPGIGHVFRKPTEGYTVLTLNAKLLLDLANAISPDGVITLFVPPNDPKGTGITHDNSGQVTGEVYAVGTDSETDTPVGFGAIMPVTAERKKMEKRRTYLTQHGANLPDRPFGPPRPAPEAVQSAPTSPV